MLIFFCFIIPPGLNFGSPIYLDPWKNRALCFAIFLFST